MHAAGLEGLLDKELGESAGPWIVVEVGGVNEGVGLGEIVSGRASRDGLMAALTCWAMSLANCGSQCPRALTAIPAVKSKYLRFSMSQTYEPSPLVNTGGGRRYVATMKGAWSLTNAALRESAAGSGFGGPASLCLGFSDHLTSLYHRSASGYLYIPGDVAPGGVRRRHRRRMGIELLAE
jgi:hypothetical protein